MAAASAFEEDADGELGPIDRYSVSDVQLWRKVDGGNTNEGASPKRDAGGDRSKGHKMKSGGRGDGILVDGRV